VNFDEKWMNDSIYFHKTIWGLYEFSWKITRNCVDLCKKMSGNGVNSKEIERKLHGSREEGGKIL